MGDALPAILQSPGTKMQPWVQVSTLWPSGSKPDARESVELRRNGFRRIDTKSDHSGSPIRCVPSRGSSTRGVWMDRVADHVLTPHLAHLCGGALTVDVGGLPKIPSPSTGRGIHMASEGKATKLILIVVVAIFGITLLMGCLGVGAAVAIPAFIKYKERSAAAAEGAAIERPWELPSATVQ